MSIQSRMKSYPIEELVEDQDDYGRPRITWNPAGTVLGAFNPGQEIESDTLNLNFRRVETFLLTFAKGKASPGTHRVLVDDVPYEVTSVDETGRLTKIQLKAMKERNP